jgi:hypothetical protein
VSENPTPPPPPTAPELADKLRPRATRADRGDKEAAHELRRLLDRPDVYRLVLDLAAQVLAVHVAAYRLAMADWDARPHWQQ